MLETTNYRGFGNKLSWFWQQIIVVLATNYRGFGNYPSPKKQMGRAFSDEKFWVGTYRIL